MKPFFQYDELSIGSKGLVFFGDKILVYRRDNLTQIHPLRIDLPGGGSESHETPYETFKRELYEEFGLKVTKRQIQYARRYESSVSPGTFAWFTVAIFPISAKLLIKFGYEGLEYIFMTPKEFIARNDVAWPAFQERTKDYLALSLRR